MVGRQKKTSKGKIPVTLGDKNAQRWFVVGKSSKRDNQQVDEDAKRVGKSSIALYVHCVRLQRRRCGLLGNDFFRDFLSGFLSVFFLILFPIV